MKRLLLCLLLFTVSAHADEGRIVIGDFMSYAEIPEFTEPTRQGWQMALEEINAAGGVLGKKLEVVSADDRGTPEDAIQVVQQLIAKNHTKLIMGGFQSHIGAAISNLAKQEGFLFGSPWSGGERMLWQDGHDLVFRIQPPPQTYGAILAKHAAKDGKKRWVTISPDYEGGHGFTNGFTTAMLKDHPNFILLKQYWPPMDKLDAGAAVQAIKRDNPEAIFTHLYGSDLVKFIREGNKRKLLDEKEVVSVVSGWQESYSGLGKDYPIGWYSTGYPAGEITSEKHKAFVKKYQDKYQKLPTFGVLHGYILMKFYAAAIEKAGSTDPYKVARAIRGLTLDTPVGDVSIRNIDGQSTIGMWVGKTAMVDGKPSLSDFVYEDGKNYLPSPKQILEMRKQK